MRSENPETTFASDDEEPEEAEDGDVGRPPQSSSPGAVPNGM